MPSSTPPVAWSGMFRSLNDEMDYEIDEVDGGGIPPDLEGTFWRQVQLTPAFHFHFHPPTYISQFRSC
jgi:carotenoid cleavage dioxygenase-like enzyme